MDVWKAGPEVYSIMENLVANEFPDLSLVDDEILIVMREKAGKVGDAVVAGKTSKANQLLGVVGETNWKFVITLAGDEWADMGNKDREALLYHHLAACGVEENPQSGVMRCFVKLPDVTFFRGEVEKYGFWRTSGATPEADLINDLFGPDQPATTGSTPPVNP